MSDWVNFLTALVVLTSVLIPVYVKVAKTSNKTDVVEHKVDEVHAMVNQQRTDMQRYQEVLTAALVAAGVPVPLDASLRSPQQDSAT